MVLYCITFRHPIFIFYSITVYIIMPQVKLFLFTVQCYCNAALHVYIPVSLTIAEKIICCEMYKN